MLRLRGPKRSQVTGPVKDTGRQPFSGWGIMTRRTDCIYCGAETGSREHPFPAALGGRRMNKGILCGACNAKFSALDEHLSRQLNFINGVIGVRPDHAKRPRPARVNSADGTLTIDHTGTPSFAGPRVIADEPHEDGGRRVSVEFADERQAQEWIAQQKAAGTPVKVESRSAGQRFISGILPIEWSFGGEDAFREIGRIALNFVAQRWPDAARSDGLQAFKDWVEGKRVLAAGEPRFVWYAPENAFPIPDSPFEFGHQVLLVRDEHQTFGRVRLFSTFDLFVWFGPECGTSSEAVIFNIDPLADHPPGDLLESAPDRWALPEQLIPPTAPTDDLAHLLGTRLRSLLSRIADRQWALGTQGLLEGLNATRTLSRREQTDRVGELMQPHRGRVLFLAREFAKAARGRATDDLGHTCADMVDLLVAADPDGHEGLSTTAQAALHVALAALVELIVRDLHDGPLTAERLRLLLAGGAGAEAIGRALLRMIVIALGGPDGESS